MKKLIIWQAQVELSVFLDGRPERKPGVVQVVTECENIDVAIAVVRMCHEGNWQVAAVKQIEPIGFAWLAFSIGGKP